MRRDEMNGTKKANAKGKAAKMLAAAAMVAMLGVFGAAPLTASASAAYDTDFTKTYVFENLIKPALTNPQTSNDGIYRQLELAFRYRKMTQGEVLDLYDLGYTVPVKVLERLYNAGYIGGYVYHRAAGMAITEADMSDVFDAQYYYNAYPDLQAVYGNNEAALFNHFITTGMAEGRRASADFDPAYFKAANPDVATALGDDWTLYYIHYIVHGVEQGRAGSAEDQAKMADMLSKYDSKK